MKKAIFAIATVAVVAAVTVAHRKGWLPEAVSSKISTAAATTKGFFAKKDQTVETPTKADTAHADAPKAEEVKTANTKAEAPVAPAPEAANSTAAPEGESKAA